MPLVRMERAQHAVVGPLQSSAGVGHGTIVA